MQATLATAPIVPLPIPVTATISSAADPFVVKAGEDRYHEPIKKRLSGILTSVMSDALQERQSDSLKILAFLFFLKYG